MTDFPKVIAGIDTDTGKVMVMNQIVEAARQAGYTDEEVDIKRPWGGFVRFATSDAKQFSSDFFGNGDVCDGIPDCTGEHSPKILMILPGERLSLQRHMRRSESWFFVTPGLYQSSESDDGGTLHSAQSGQIVKVATGNAHRITGSSDEYTIVAEIWHHSDPDKLSDEADEVRLEDDYRR